MKILLFVFALALPLAAFAQVKTNEMPCYDEDYFKLYDGSTEFDIPCDCEELKPKKAAPKSHPAFRFDEYRILFIETEPIIICKRKTKPQTI